MTVYLIYFFLILIIPSLCLSSINNKQKAQETALRILMFLMYLMLALKAESVGSDISGYGEWYNITKSMPFWDFSYCYMENGYLLLMKMGNMIGLSFQGFEAVIYGIAILSMYYFLKNNSSNIMISVLVLYCVDFYVFASSGLRQTVAIALCAASFTYLTKSVNTEGKKYSRKTRALLFSFLMVLVAASFHRSALIFAPLLLIVFFRYKTITYAVYIMAVAFIVLNPGYFINYNVEHEMSHYHYDERLTLGLMFVFDVSMFVFFLISTRVNKESFNKVYTWQYSSVILYGFVTMLAFNGSILLRSSLYELVFLAIIMPNAIQSWNPSIKRLMTWGYVIVMFLCFYYLILVPNTLMIVPYKFFFE